MPFRGIGRPREPPRGAARTTGLVGCLVGEGRADGEGRGDSACSSAKLQLVGVLRRGKCSGVAAAAGWEGTTGGTRGLLRRVGLLA